MLFSRLRPLAVILALVSLAAVPQAAAQELTAEPEAVEFGDLFDGELAKAVVLLRNAGDSDWAVRQVTTTCGCTVATLNGPDGSEIPNRPRSPGLPVVTLKPGETLTIGVELLTANQRGSVEKKLQIYPMDTSLETLTVPVRARITKAFAMSPPNINLSTISKSDPIDRTVVLQAQSVGDWTIEGFTSAIEGQPLPSALTFEVLDEEGPSRRIKISTSGPLSVGTLTSKVRVQIGHERVSFIDFYIYGMVEADVRFDTGSETTPGSLSFEKIQLDSVVTRTVTITNHDESNPYLLESADIQSPDVDFFVTTIRVIEEGQIYEVDVTVDGAIGEGFFRGNLVLHADHSDVPKRSISFHGWVRKS